MTEAKDKFRVTQSKHGPNLDLTAKATVGSVHAEDLASGGRRGGEDQVWQRKEQSSPGHRSWPFVCHSVPLPHRPTLRRKKADAVRGGDSLLKAVQPGGNSILWWWRPCSLTRNRTTVGKQSGKGQFLHNGMEFTSGTLQAQWLTGAT